jgi:Rod binding domain-containing protein
MQINSAYNQGLQGIGEKDFSQALKRGGAQKELESAQEFESMFIQSMLKEIRPKTDEDGLFSSGLGEDVFYQMMDEAIAKEIAKSPNGFGIAEAVMKQNFE